jgi:hypothetical protein
MRRYNEVFVFCYCCPVDSGHVDSGQGWQLHDELQPDLQRRVDLQHLLLVIPGFSSRKHFQQEHGPGGNTGVIFC